MTRAMYAMTGNPFHFGHYDIACQAALIFDQVYVLLAHNADKGFGHTSKEAIEKDLEGCGDITVVEIPLIESTPALTVDFAQDYDIDCLIRGVRGVKDFMAETEMADINEDLSLLGGHSFGLKTVFLLGGLQFRHISSSLIRGLPRNNPNWPAAIQEYMPKHSAEEFIARNSK